MKHLKQLQEDLKLEADLLEMKLKASILRLEILKLQLNKLKDK